VRAPLLAFRPARVVERLGPRSAACPLSSKDLLRAAAPLHLPLPLVRAPTPGVMRAALVAAKQARSVLGLGLPAGADPEAWFRRVIEAVDGLAALWPIFLAGEVVVEGAEPSSLEAARAAAWRLADAGLTHLAVDLSRLPAEARADALRVVAEAALERGLGLECQVEAGAATGVTWGANFTAARSARSSAIASSKRPSTNMARASEFLARASGRRAPP